MNRNVNVDITLTRDEKIFLWNFMEELIKKYQEAGRLEDSLFFAIKDFESTKLPILSLDCQSVLEILYKFVQITGLVKISDGTVAFTNKGLLVAQKSLHDWC